MQHNKVTETYYNISLGKTNREMPKAIDEFLDGMPDVDEDNWNDSISVMRDYEGDFEGIEIYPCETTLPVIEFICQKIGIDFEENKGISFKIVT